MSQYFRPPVGTQPTMSGRMIPPNHPTNHLQGVMPVHPYGMVTAHPQYISHPPFAHNIQNVPANQMPVLTSVRAPLRGMYGPTAPSNAGISPMNVDPAKLLEEQRKLEKERNFQLQQQRLKQFTVAGKKGSLNAENLIDSMFGKVQPKQSFPPPSSFGEFHDFESAESFMKPTFETSHPQPHKAVVQEVKKIIPQKPVKKDKKELEAMMQECSDLKSGPLKAHTFTKPAVRELTPAAQQRSTYTASNKSRDWKNLQGFEEIFVANKPRFPDWCKTENVPELYRQIEAFVTTNGAHAPDTKLLFPILLSSGLAQQILGKIWELVNQSAPGCLTVEEMYAALALIAVTQAGHPVKTVDILNQLPACPIPQLQCFALQPNPNDQASDITTPITSNDPATHQVLRPSAISLKSNTSGHAAETSGSGFISSPDDDFDDFKSATPTAVNFSINTPSSNLTQSSDSFDDFLQAPPTFPTTNQNIEATTDKHPVPHLTKSKPPASDFAKKFAMSENKFQVPPNNKFPEPPMSEKFPVPSISEKRDLSGKNVPVGLFGTGQMTTYLPPTSQDLMSPDEDKYSVFRSLQQNDESEEWGDFSAVTSADMARETDINESSQSSTPTFPSEFLSNPAANENVFVFKAGANLTQNNLFSINPTGNVKENDIFASNLSNPKENNDFGDFLHADPTTIKSVTHKLEQLPANFADFANFNDPTPQVEDEFGDFASSLPVKSGQEFALHHAKDNNSSVEGHRVQDPTDDFGDFSSSLRVKSEFALHHVKDNNSSVQDPTDDFGDFASGLQVKSELGHEFVFHHVRDNISLAESQSVSSLELGTFDGGGHSGESKSSLSRQGSIPSLDLKNGGVETGDNDEFGEFQSQAAVRATPSPAIDLKMNGSNCTSNNSVSLSLQNTRNTPLIDKYSVIRSEERKDEDQHISCWIRCLQSSVNILQNTKKIFNQMSCSSVCNEVLKSEEGENYIKDVIEVYKVISRIAVASKAAGKQTPPLLDLMKEADQAWHTICGFIAGSSLMPEDGSLEFSKAVLSSKCEDITQACGLCLLNIDIKSRSSNKEDSLKLSYGGRNYHSTCANLWVNCVDRLLPALILPQLL